MPAAGSMGIIQPACSTWTPHTGSKSPCSMHLQRRGRVWHAAISCSPPATHLLSWHCLPVQQSHVKGHCTWHAVCHGAPILGLLDRQRSLGSGNRSCRAASGRGNGPTGNNRGGNGPNSNFQQPIDPWDINPPPINVPPPPQPPPQTPVQPEPDTQASRLRRFMQNIGMAGIPGMAQLGVTAAAATAFDNGPKQPGQQPPGQTRQQPASASGSAGGWGATERVTDATAKRQSDRLRRMMRDLGMPEPPQPPQPPSQQQSQQSRRVITASEINEWGSDWTEDWDPEEDLDAAARAAIADQAEAEQQRLRREQETRGGAPRDKWITPLLDLRAVTGAVDPDQERTEDMLQGEALANKDESQTAIRYTAQIILLPLITGFVLSRALADPILNFTLQNNQEAFAMTDRQKVEGAEKVHIEEARLRFDMAIGKLPPLSEAEILEHLREFAEEVQEEERHSNEQNLITVVSDSISSIMLFSMISQQSRGRMALFNTLSRLFDGLSDIAKAVMIILIADTLLGYHSEEGWTGLIELIVGHYGFEPDEEALVIFVGVVPVVIDVFFKYWIFIGLNRISPGAVVTIKQIDTH